MPCRKFLALTLRVQVAICEGLFESGPELVLQTVIIVHGVHLEDLQVYILLCYHNRLIVRNRYMRQLGSVVGTFQ